MLICNDCVNYFLGCPVNTCPIRYGLCELCGNNAHCNDIVISEKRNNDSDGLDDAADIIRDEIRVLYYLDFDLSDGLNLAEYTIRTLSARSAEELANYVLSRR